METSTVLIAGAGIAVLMLVARNLTANRPSKEAMMDLLEQGAVIIDVRTPKEFAQGHAPGSCNIPLDVLNTRFSALDRSKPILVCCASGTRSAMAKRMLETAGFTQVQNAGPWRRLLKV
jgi:phage shock protein E